MTKSYSTPATILMWMVPLLLIVPNVALDITEQSYSWLDRTINVLLPFGAYCLAMSCTSRSGMMSVLLFPVMFFCGFQIVLLNLYGESIIAVDMFLNVLTTNPEEAGELLENLGPAVAVVCILYLPPLFLGIVLWAKGSPSQPTERRSATIVGAVAASTGLVLMFTAMCGGYRPDRKLFPVNVVSNMFEAFRRDKLSHNYFQSSSGFCYHAVANGEPGEREIYVFVIGETSRADNWELNGYERPTNPRLSQRDGLISYKRVLSESNTTHKSVPLMMSPWDATTFGDSVFYSKGVIEAFNEAGFHTAWISNQQRNHSLIDFFGERADECTFLQDDGGKHYDCELCGRLRDMLGRKENKLFVVLHSYGSHFNYRERYPEDHAFFPEEKSAEASPANRPALINDYDNSIRYVDEMLDSIAGILEDSGRKAAMVYLADHGEDIFDDNRERFLHASPTPTYWQLHVPMLVWMSDSYRLEHPDKHEAAVANSGRNVSSSRSAFHTLLSIAEVSTPYYSPEAALTEKGYTEPKRIYLNDYNEAVGLRDCGLRQPDFDNLRMSRISY